MRLAIIAFLALALGACASSVTRHPEFGRDCESFGANVDCVRVFYGTNRAVLEADLAADAETDIAATPGDAADTLTLGRADVWLPRLVQDGGDREIGETPMAKGEAPDDRREQERYVFITRVTAAGRERFVADLQRDVDLSGRGSVLLFVHGFNVTFDAAVIRSAELAKDLAAGRGFNPGAPVLFSWPSKGRMSLGSYRRDEESAAAAAPYLTDFLDILTGDLSVRRINIVAHSMGNRVLTRALEEYASRYLEAHPERDVEFRIVLAAADVERDVFDLVADRIAGLEPNVTIYASDDDLALRISRLINKAVRLGDTDGDKPYIRTAPGYTTIDATPVASELFGIGHGYYSDNPFILNDIRCAMADTPVDGRALSPKPYGGQEGAPVYFLTREAGEALLPECALRRTAFPAAARKDEPVRPGSRPPPPASPPSSPPPPVAAPAPVPTELRAVVYFESGQTWLSAEANAVIEGLIQAVPPGASIRQALVAGHSDDVGSSEAKRAVSRARAESVREALIARGFDPAAIRVEAYGADRPAVASPPGAPEPLNRRVEILIVLE